MQNLLITFGTRALAQRLSNLLKNDFTIHFATSEEVPVFLNSKFMVIPVGSNPTYAHELLKICLDQQIQILLPIGLSEVKAIAEAKVLFEEYNIQVLTPSLEELEEVFVFTNPATSVAIHVAHQGQCLDVDKRLNTSLSGVLAVSDDAENVALCVV